MAERTPSKRYKKVALIIESMMAPRRTMMRGFARYMQEHEPWSIYLKPGFGKGTVQRWVEHWDGDGIIGNLSPGEMEHFKGTTIPFVDIAGYFPDHGYCIARADDRAIGRMGAEHLLERGFKHFAFCEIANTFWSQYRREGFEEVVGRYGHTVHRHFDLKPSAGQGGPDDWELKQQQMGEWIESLPKPLGIMTTTDFHGRQILEACQRMAINVPDTVAVLGADNDEDICRIATPPLSSVIINDEQRGYEAASLLDQLMQGNSPPNRHVLVSPSGVKIRASTDVYSLDDEVIVSALKYLRDNVEQHPDIDRLASDQGVSRSTLERRFFRQLGRTINDEVIRLRVNLAIELLSETQLPLKSVATRCGFSSQAYMSSVFKDKCNRTPGSYRNQVTPRNRL